MYVRQLPVNSVSTATTRWSPLSTCCAPHPRIAFRPVRVLVAGDHANLRSSLKTVLEMDPHIAVIGEATDECETVKMAKRFHPDVILIDLEMRNCDCFDSVAEITRRNLASAVIGLTINDDEGERTAATQAGVGQFLEKGVTCKQLIEAVRRAGSEGISSHS